MTGINLVSSMIYTKGAPLKTRIQLYVMAAVFLVLLYSSPAGLTLYWTLNNLFSLLKNIITKSDRNKKYLAVLLAAAGFVLLITSLILVSSVKRKLICVLIALFLQLPALLQLLRGREASGLKTRFFSEKEPHPGNFSLRDWCFQRLSDC